MLHLLRKFGWLSILALTALFIFSNPSTVKALPYELPDRDYFRDEGGSINGFNVNLLIAQGGSEISLDVDETWVKLFYDGSGGPEIGVQIDHGAYFCDAGDPKDSRGLSGTCNDAGAIDYNLYWGDPASQGKNPMPTPFKTVNSSSLGLTYQNVHQGVPPGPMIDTGTGMRHIIYVQAVWVTAPPGEGRINSFRVASTVGGGESSFWAQGSGYAVQNRLEPEASEGEFNFEFAPQCNEPATQLASLVWQDADAATNGGVPPDGNDYGTSWAGDDEVYFELYEANPDRTGWTLLTTVSSSGATNGYTFVSGSNVGGDGANGQLQFTARNDKIYSWKWHKVNRFNGVQMVMPFDSYYSRKTCGPPPPPPTPSGPTVSTVCQIDGTTAFTVNWDPANNPPGTSQYYVDVGPNTSFAANDYWNKGPIALGTNSASGPSGFYRWPQPPTIAMPELEPGQNYYARIYYEGPNTHSAPQGPFTTACAPPQLSCNSFNPQGMEQGSPPFTMTVGFSNAPFRTRLKDASVSIRINTTYGAQAVSPNPLRGNSSTTTSNTINVPPPGAHTVSLIFTGGNTPGSPLTAVCPGEFQVYNRPYFRVFGGDVMTGGYDAIGCPAWPQTSGSPGSIFAFNNFNGRGAGTQLLVQAMAAVNGFSSAQHRTPSPPYPSAPQPSPDKGLTFANNGASQFGGAFNIGSCPPDYFANKPTVINGSLPVFLPLLQNTGAYLSSPNITLPLVGNVIYKGKTIIQYVDGNAYILGNIVYDDSTPWVNVKDIPSYTMVVKGDIYIASTVTRLDGIYIAQPRSAAPGDGGTIYTCSVTPPAIPNALQIANQCTSPLTFNGAVMARTIKLFRSTGTVREANPADCPLSHPTSNIYNCTGSSTAAEQFIYTPEIWIRSNLLRRPPRPATYDVISNLPPIL